MTLSKNLPAFVATGLAVDGSGNICVMAFPYLSGFPLENNLAPCVANTVSSSLAALTVLDPSGRILQSTYVPGVRQSPVAIAALSVLSDSAVYLVGMPGSTYVPTQQLAGSSGGLLTLTRLSVTAQTPTQLACIGNAASYDGTAMSPGEMVSLFGFGLGPANGTEPQVNGHTGFPTELANVRVTFNGTPGPLLYV